MDLQQLKTFIAIVKTGSFTKAAEVLEYAQSSVSAQIRTLEDEFDTRLFERMGREIALTESGRRFLAYAEQFIKLTEEARQSVSSTGEPAGTLIIGAPESICVFRLPPLLLQYRRLYPNVRLVLKQGSCKDLYTWTRQNLLDIAFLLDVPGSYESLQIEPLRMEPMTLVAGRDHPLSGQKPYNPLALNGEDLILVEEGGCCYRTLFERQLDAAGVQLGSVQEFGSVEMIKKCVYSGLGLSLLPRMTVEDEIQKGLLADLYWDTSQYNIYTLMVLHKDKWRSPALGALVDLAREQLMEKTVSDQ